MWSGTITFGLVSLPVNLYPANRSKPVSLRMVDAQGTPLARRYFCEQEERVLDYDELIRGYEVEKHEFVVVEDRELASLAPEKSQEIDLKRFVGLDEIDPMYFQRAYFMTPDKGVTKAYRLLAQSMESAGRAGIATFVMRGKEYLVAIIAEKGILRAETLRFAEEVRTPEDIALPEPTQPDKSRAKAMQKAIEALTVKGFEREELQDLQSQRIVARAEEKLSRGEDVIALGEEDTPDVEPEQGGEVIDLMQVLKQSLAEGRPPGQEARNDAGKRKTEKRAKPAARRSETKKRPSGQRAKGKQRADGGKAATRGKRRSTELAELEGLSRDELYQRAQQLDLPGRSRMSKAELARAIAAAG
nr:Ku protein [Halomonas kenyensis]